MMAEKPMPRFKVSDVDWDAFPQGKQLLAGDLRSAPDEARCLWEIIDRAPRLELHLTISLPLPAGCEARTPRARAHGLHDLLLAMQGPGIELLREFLRPASVGQA
jgi:hypothetical protein